MLEAQRLREQILPMLLPCGIKQIAVFGSTVRNEERPDSDLDLLVSFKHSVGLFAIARLRRQLSEILAQPVDLVTRDALSPYILQSVEEDKVIIYEE